MNINTCYNEKERRLLFFEGAFSSETLRENAHILSEEQNR
jgi:hypothetical protein